MAYLLFLNRDKVAKSKLLLYLWSIYILSSYLVISFSLHPTLSSCWSVWFIHILECSKYCIVSVGSSLVRCNYNPSSSWPPVSSFLSSVSACIMSTGSYPSSMSPIVTSSSIPVAASSLTPLGLSRMGCYQKCSFVVVYCLWLASGIFCGMTLILNIICGLCHCYKYYNLIWFLVIEQIGPQVF